MRYVIGSVAAQQAQLGRNGIGGALYKIAGSKHPLIILDDLVQEFYAVFHSPVGRADDDTIQRAGAFNDRHSGAYTHSYCLAHPAEDAGGYSFVARLKGHQFFLNRFLQRLNIGLLKGLLRRYAIGLVDI